MAKVTWRLTGISHYYKGTSTKRRRDAREQEFIALDRVTFTQPYGEIVGIIGGKGAGKSTLGKILLGELEPSEGLISGRSENYYALQLPDRRSEDRTGESYTRQQLAKWGVSKRKIPQVVEVIGSFSELGKQFQRKIRRYSESEKSQLALSILLHLAPTVIYIDESLLDVKEHYYLKVLTFLAKLKELGSSIWIETTHVNRLEGYCDKMVWLEFGQLKKQGSFAEVLRAYEVYYATLHCLSTDEQKVFWEDGYATQWVTDDLEDQVINDQVLAYSQTVNIAHAEEIDDEGEVDEGKLTVAVAKEPLTLSRSQSRQLKPKKRRRWLGVVALVALLAGGVVFAVQTPEIKALWQQTLPNTRGGGQSTEKSRLFPNSTDSSQSMASSSTESQEQSTESSTEVLADTYVVKAGETLSQIAERYNISLQQLREWNQLTSDEVHPDMVLAIRQSAAKKTDPVKPTQVASFTHQVKSGDTLEAIADAYGVSVAELQAVNQLVDMTIYSGAVLSLPVSAKKPTAVVEQTPQTVTNNPVNTSSQHVVSQGETLYGIARKYGVDVMALQKANQLQTEQLALGEVLVIP